MRESLSISSSHPSNRERERDADPSFDWVPQTVEAIRMVERGDASAKDIDTAMKLGAGESLASLYIPWEKNDSDSFRLGFGFGSGRKTGYRSFPSLPPLPSSYPFTFLSRPFFRSLPARLKRRTDLFLSWRRLKRNETAMGRSYTHSSFPTLPPSRSRNVELTFPFGFCSLIYT